MALKRVILIRHAESLEDVNETLHNVTDDRSITLTSRGEMQARKLGQILSRKITVDGEMIVHLSSSFRAQQTWGILSRHLPEPRKISMDRRIRNLDWGNITLDNRAHIEAERYKVGVLRYKFPGGDNTPDYTDAISAFSKEAVAYRKDMWFPTYIIIATHGFALRVIARYLLKLSDVEFKWLRNPPNGYCLHLAYKSNQDRFVATTPLLQMEPVE